LKEWTAKVGHIINCIGSDNQPVVGCDDNDMTGALNAPLTVLMSEAEKWRAALSHAIDSSDTLIAEQVHQ